MPTESQRLIRRQCLRNAEGYLELATVFDDRWPLPRSMRFTLAHQALDSLAQYAQQQSSDTSEKADAFFLRGLALDLLEQHEQAAQQLAASLAEDPHHAEAYSHLAWCYRQLENWEKAILTLQQGMRHFSDNPLFYYNAACYSCLSGNHDQTLQYLLHAFRLDHSLSSKAETDTDFQHLHDDPRFRSIVQQSLQRSRQS